jgi:hypothetical protein
MHNYKKESGRTTKRRKSEKLNHFFKRDLKEIIRALNSKNEFFTLDTTGNSEEFIRYLQGTELYPVHVGLNILFQQTSHKILYEKQDFNVLKITNLTFKTDIC